MTFQGYNWKAMQQGATFSCAHQGATFFLRTSGCHSLDAARHWCLLRPIYFSLGFR